MGKVEDVSKPTATVEISIEWKKVVQCMAKMFPIGTTIDRSFLELAARRCFKQSSTIQGAADAKRVRPRTIRKSGMDKKFPNKPARPNNSTAS